MAYQEYGVSELNIFEPQPLQSEIQRCQNLYCSPVTSLNKATTIEFFIPSTPEHYIDLNSILLELKIQFLKGSTNEEYSEQIFMDTTNAKLVDETKSKDLAKNQPALVANGLHALFRSITVFMNNKQVRFVDNYPFKDYIVKMLNWDEANMKTILVNEGFIKDTAGTVMDGLGDKNAGLKARRAAMTNSCMFDAAGLLQIDICKMSTFLLPNVDLKFVLNLENPDFYTMEKSTNTSRLHVHEAVLRVKRFTVSPKVLMQHHQKLGRGEQAVYPFRGVELKAFTIAQGVRGANIDNIFTGIVPTSVVVALVSNAGYSGNREKNPYYFHHYNVSSVGVYVNGLCVTQEPIDVDYSSGLYARAYHQLYEGTGKLANGFPNSITRPDFKKGYCIYPFIISPLQHLDEAEIADVPTAGIVRVELKFSAATSESLTALILAEFDSQLMVDKNYNVAVLT